MIYPHITIYTDRLPANVAGRANGPLIRIKPAYKNDAGIHAHELVHVAQFWRFGFVGFGVAALLMFVPQFGEFAWAAPIAAAAGFGLHSILYMASKRYRLWSEVSAYKEQLKHYTDDRRQLFAWFIYAHYGLDVTQDEAFKLL
ncbi:hypothetical protein [Rhodoferax sp.]|uniref:hypothetical protein n=1 Tax=Rhodoferax sp. TaxID=50421 RepID=UPI0026102039|nr:hypothetical protein [Rhodoferax sp.]MDD3938098.1 hypothetical protein [Rhodoferax sp.]